MQLYVLFFFYFFFLQSGNSGNYYDMFADYGSTAISYGRLLNHDEASSTTTHERYYTPEGTPEGWFMFSSVSLSISPLPLLPHLPPFSHPRLPIPHPPHTPLLPSPSLLMFRRWSPLTNTNL